MIDKLALGTVQFGTVYGINNKNGQVPEKEVAGILRRAGLAGIDMLDTAQSYGESEAVLGTALQSLNSRFKIVSKFVAGPHLTPRRLFSESLIRLKADRLYAFLYHKFSDFRDYPGWHEELLELKTGGHLEKVGFSVYYPQELQSLLDRGVKFDIVQLPYNVFDRRFEFLFPALRKQNIEVHVRSVFLQGLVFMKSSEIPAALAGIKTKISRLHAVSKKSGVPVSALCLCFGLLNDGIDRVVIGVDGLADLENNLTGLNRRAETEKVCDELCLLREDDEGLILPSKWKK